LSSIKIIPFLSQTALTSSKSLTKPKTFVKNIHFKSRDAYTLGINPR
jgi:hypothetical protein